MATAKKSRKLKSVKGATAAPAAAEAAPRAPAPTGPAAVDQETAKNLVNEAYARFTEACEKLETGVDLLNAAGPAYWKTVTDEALKKEIADFVQKAMFGATSLRDAVAGAANAPVQKKNELPTVEMPVSQIPMAAIFTDAPSAADLAGARDTVGLALTKLIQTEIPMGESERGLRVVTFLIELHKNLKAMADKAAGVAA